MLNTSACRDHDDIPVTKRVVRGGRDLGKAAAAKEEAKFNQHIKQRRAELRDGNRGSIRHTHSVPSDLFHGKIRETGDKQYWDDPKNLKKHKSTEVS